MGSSPFLSPQLQTLLKERKAPICCLVIGMAGSGKTTLLQRINAWTHEKERASYIVNLDPAVMHVPYGANIDIRDTVSAGGDCRSESSSDTQLLPRYRSSSRK